MHAWLAAFELPYRARIKSQALPLQLCLLVAFVSVVVMAMLAWGVSAAQAMTLSGQQPTEAVTQAVADVPLSVTLSDSVPLVGQPVLTVDGQPVPATLTYRVAVEGYWYYDEYDGEWYWQDPVLDYTQATVNGTAFGLADGVRVAAVAMPSGTAPTSGQWTFRVAAPPAITAETPTSAVVPTLEPEIGAILTDNSVIETYTVVLDGVERRTTFDPITGTLRVLLDAPLANLVTHNVTVSASDAGGLTATKGWSFTTDAAAATWSALSPARNGVVSAKVTGVKATVAASHSLYSTTASMSVDGVKVMTVFSAIDANSGTLTGLPNAVTADGTHTVAASILTSRGLPATTSWKFRVAIPPTLGSPTPVDGAHVDTRTPEIKVPATDNGAIASVQATVNGLAADATVANGVAAVSPRAPLPNDATSTVTVTVTDAIGAQASTTWSFYVQVNGDMDVVDDCVSCHVTYHAGGAVNIDGVSCNECHTSVHTGTPQQIHARSTTACGPCHQSSLTIEHHGRTDATGAEITCVTCHQSTDPRVLAAIAAHTTECDACHTTTPDHASVHVSSVATQTLAGTTSVCGDCHDGSSLPAEHAKASSSSTGSGCETCHPAPRNELTSAWGKGCVQGGCHAAGTSSAMHGSMEASHTPVAGQTCFASSCHPAAATQSFMVTHANATAVTEGSVRNVCMLCHSGDVPASRVCASCHADKADGTHASGTHTFSSASNFVAATEAGCTNSGAGCHGAESDYADFTTYHPTTGCLSGACHTSPSKAGYAGSRECVSCHDGGFVGAPDVVGLTAATPNGHFSETTHTASGLAATVTSGGSASATCSNCHNSAPATGPKGLAGQHTGVPVAAGSPYGATVSCVECHSDTRAGGSAAVISGWSARTCASCHSLASSAPMHGILAPQASATSPVGCAATAAGCHVGADLHALHRNAAGGCSITGCHDYTKQAAKPVATSCGTGASCHTNKADGSHGYSAAAHTATPTSASITINGTSYAAGPCAGCHDAVLGAEHAKATSVSKAAGCAACHPTPRSSLTPSWNKATCAQGGCHTASSATPQHGAIDAKHALPSSTDADCAAAGCHAGDLASLHAGAVDTQANTSCMVCHGSGVPASSSCRSCHGATGSAAYNTLMNRHNDGTVHTATPASQTLTISGVTYPALACTSCHATQIATSHGGTGACRTCHSTKTSTLTPSWNKGCAQGACHTASSATPMHASIDTSHAPVASQSCYAATCHAATATQSLAETHRNASAVLGGSTRTSCMVCHYDGTPASRTCASCHADKVDGTHATGSHTFSTASNFNSTTVTGCTNSGAGCHGSESTFADFTAYHPATGCTSGRCHTSSSKATYAGAGECVSCHNGNFSGAPDVVNITGATPNGHYAETTHTASGLTATVTSGGTASATCTTCHAAGTASKGLFAQHQGISVAGVSTSITCAGCHNKSAAVSAVVAADWNGKACSACHTASVLPSAIQHTSTAPAVAATAGTYAATGQSCLTAGCHGTNDLHAIHKDASGCTLTGCHDAAKQGAKPTAKSCGATGACHTAAEPHAAALLASAHNASSQPLAQPGTGSVTSTSTQSPVSQTFATSTWPSDWARTSTTYLRVQNNAGRVRTTYAAELYSTSTTRRTFEFTRDVDLTTFSNATLGYWESTVGFAGGSDYAKVDYSVDGGATWTTVSNLTATTAWTSRTVALPVGKTVRVRFSGSVNSTTEFCDWDDISISGTASTTSVAPLPANTPAATSCQNNPSGTECHVVADVRTLHSAVPGACAACHKAGGPTNNCQTAGCHSTQFVNVDTHNATAHATTLISTAAGQPFAGSGLTNAACTGCHDDSISLEHSVLSAYAATRCSMCHNKTANSGAPSLVTAADVQAALAKATGTVLCTDCHKTVTATAIHVQRVGVSGTAGSTQFDPTWSGHRTSNTMFGSRTGGTGSTFNGQATSITWTLPTATSWLKTGWTSTTQLVQCTDCHGSFSGATGPHGASMAIGLAAGYDNSYSAGTLTLSGTSMSNTTNICAKCHTTSGLGYNNVHSRGDHNGSCIQCHVKVPHAWKRPRLIGYTSDPVQYRTTRLTGMTQKSYTPTGWQKANCGVTGCGSHGSTAGTPVWP